MEINVFLRFKRQYDESDSVERYLAKTRGALSLPALDEAYQQAWADVRSSALRIERLKFIIREDMDWTDAYLKRVDEDAQTQHTVRSDCSKY